MFTQYPFLNKEECNELLEFYELNYDSTFRLDWGHESRYQRLLPIHDKPLQERIESKLIFNHPYVCEDLGIDYFDPHFMEIYISKYEVGEGVGWHKDRSTYEYEEPIENTRIYNFSITLNSDFRGGDLLVDYEYVPKILGASTMFSITQPHKVDTISSGTRYSLIGWVYKKTLL
jgi:predicted 2-oxoglutarate/Fe(II)-dependent dioxygenase YbiX